MTTILVIPDSHAKPNQDLSRFSNLGRLIVDLKPDYIVDIGDSADMESLSKYDVGSVHAEGKRYIDDIEAYRNAMFRLISPTITYNFNQTKKHKKIYNPRLIKCLGNHEQRIIRAANETPSLFGHLSIDDLRHDDWGWEVYPFLQPVEIEGIAFQHYFTSGIMGRAIGGDNHAASIVKKGYRSCVAGHSHTRDFWETTDVFGKKVFGLVVGCYVEHEEHYTTEQDRWWSGVVLLQEVKDGQAEPRFISIDYIKEHYGQ